ncbi:MAG: hypothetical protein M0002_00620 [Rhodospirillales bacterium]|nr:hypothetical protein [Rhodospirillales bacterium]
MSRSLELHAVISLARLWLSEDRRDDALAVLKPAIDWFAECDHAELT